VYRIACNTVFQTHSIKTVGSNTLFGHKTLPQTNVIEYVLSEIFF
jgi:hypothetical protein